MPKSLTETLDDPDFRKLKPSTQKAVLKHMGVSDQLQGKLLEKIAQPTATAAATPAPSSAAAPQVPNFLQRVRNRVGSQGESTIQAVNQSVRDLSKGEAFTTDPSKLSEGAKHTREMLQPFGPGALSSVAGAVSYIPRTVFGQVSDTIKDWTKDPANMAGDILLGEMVGRAGGAEHPSLKNVEEAAAERVPKPAKVKPADVPVPEHMRHLSKDERIKYAADVDKANQAAADKRADQVAKIAAEKQVHTAVRDAQNNIMSTHRAVRSALDDRWNNMREDMKGAQVSGPEDIHNGIRDAEKEYLRGAPQTIQQFRNLLRELNIEDFVENEDGTLAAAPDDAGKPLDWETARVHYTAIGDKLAGGGLPGNVYQALKRVQGVLDSKLKSAADGAGKGHEYAALKTDWSEYMRDWKNKGAMSKGGSPLAHVMDMPDAGYARVPMTGPAADRLAMTMEKYRSYGAQPELVGKVRNLHAESRMPRPKRVPLPKPAPKAMSPMNKALVRTAGHGIGLAGGTAIGHPWMGWGAGGALSEAAIKQLERRRARAANMAVPVEMVP